MARGGVRIGAGRRAADGVIKVIQVKVGLTQDMIDYAEGHGDGNVSAGLRKLVTAAMEGGGRLQSTAKPEKAVTKRPPPPKWKKTMRDLKLKFDGRDWTREGTILSMNAVRLLKRDYPELEEAEAS